VTNSTGNKLLAQTTSKFRAAAGESFSCLVGDPAAVCKSPYPSLLRHRVLRVQFARLCRKSMLSCGRPATGSAVRNFHWSQCIWHATRNFHPVGRSIAAVGRLFDAGSEPAPAWELTIVITVHRVRASLQRGPISRWMPAACRVGLIVTAILLALSLSGVLSSASTAVPAVLLRQR
jgi:hypothetical protein